MTPLKGRLFIHDVFVMVACIYNLIYIKQWRIQDFPEEDAPTPQGAPTYDFAIFFQKLHEIERIWAPGGRIPRAPLRSATVKY